ncbi:unnamed protein product [Microthlaspi erraticum]|uniref:Uncharacterized protein n=1 Tax=Microthlaspi erraticum TaxID=1685480 RepID=A0A6D2KD92_9BRAS|nr:unnamed protein product [Microthlaspi erraticum]
MCSLGIPELNTTREADFLHKRQENFRGHPRPAIRYAWCLGLGMLWHLDHLGDTFQTSKIWSRNLRIIAFRINIRVIRWNSITIPFIGTGLSSAFFFLSTASRSSTSAATLTASSISALSTTLSASAAADASSTAAFLQRSAASAWMAPPRSLSGRVVDPV